MNRGDNFECWEWRAGKIPDGYGVFWSGVRVVLAHRFAYEMMRKAIPAGLVIDHLCRNRGCVNPSHMEVVTPAENTRRAVFHNSTKVVCKQGHPFDTENTGTYGGRRYCRACRRAWSKKYRREAKEKRLLSSLQSRAASGEKLSLSP